MCASTARRGLVRVAAPTMNYLAVPHIAVLKYSRGRRRWVSGHCQQNRLGQSPPPHATETA